jgi:hypothetical protein
MRGPLQNKEAVMGRVVRAFPLLPGKRDAFDSFIAELKARHDETNVFYRGYGVVRESAHLQSTPQGDLVIVCTDLDDVQSAASSYKAATEPFDAWFKAKVLEMSGIDPNERPLGPDCRCVFDWQDAR